MKQLKDGEFKMLMAHAIGRVRGTDSIRKDRIRHLDLGEIHPEMAGYTLGYTRVDDSIKYILMYTCQDESSRVIMSIDDGWNLCHMCALFYNAMTMNDNEVNAIPIIPIGG